MTPVNGSWLRAKRHRETGVRPSSLLSLALLILSFRQVSLRVEGDAELRIESSDSSPLIGMILMGGRVVAGSVTTGTCGPVAMIVMSARHTASILALCQGPTVV